MQATGRFDWNEVFKKPPAAPAAPTAPRVPPTPQPGQSEG